MFQYSLLPCAATRFSLPVFIPEIVKRLQTTFKTFKVKSWFQLEKPEGFYDSPQISLCCSLLPKYCGFKYLCDAVLSITNAVSNDLHRDCKKKKVQIGANCTWADIFL